MATREVVTLNETTPQLEVPQAGDTYEMPRDVNITGNLTVTGTSPGSGDLLADGTVPLTANWDVGAFSITALTFTSDQATGTAPFTVASTTQVANLNAATAGNADTVTTNANLTGPVTSVGNATAIADKALAIAKLADGTAGELITWSNLGVIEAVAVGTATEVLTSNGIGLAPTFQAAGGGGGFTNIVDDNTRVTYGLGLNALAAHTTGNLRTLALGGGALASATDCDQSVVIGYNAGTNITLGMDTSVVIGVEACDAASNTGAASKNVVVGYGAGGVGNWSGAISNVLVGAQVGIDLSSGDFNVLIGQSAADDLNSGSRNVSIGYTSGNGLTTGDSNVFIGDTCPIISGTEDYQFVVATGSQNTTTPAIEGYFGASTDVDISAKDLTITGTSAYLSASTNLNAGDLILQGGTAATTGIGVGGDLILKGGLKGSTGTQGKVQVSDVFNVAAVYTVATLPSGAVGDVARISDGDGSLAWGATAVNSGGGATPYLVWFNASNWTILGS